MKKRALKIPFVKMNGAGNDFVLIDNRKGHYQLRWSSLARKMCDRRFGIGADGLLVLERSTKNDFTMLYFNADGSSGGMCGNGGRCASAFVMDGRIGSVARFDALGYTYLATKKNTQIWLTMKKPKINYINKLLNIAHKKVMTSYVDTGSPHVILFTADVSKQFQKDITRDWVVKVGRSIRHHKDFSPKGTNVNFLTVVKKGIISMRTYERGVEDETLACGTGAVASAITISLLLGWKSPVKVKTRGGEVLTVRFRKDKDTFSNVQLCGKVSYNFKGYWNK